MSTFRKNLTNDPGPAAYKPVPRTYIGHRGDPTENFLLLPGEPKVESFPDPKMPNCSTLVFHREDHTLGNLLRSALLQHADVSFVAYRMIHPLDNRFDLRVQCDRGKKPEDAVVEVCKDLQNQLKSLKEQVTREFVLKEIVDSAREKEKEKGVQEGPPTPESLAAMTPSSEGDWLFEREALEGADMEQSDEEGMATPESVNVMTPSGGSETSVGADMDHSGKESKNGAN